MQESDDRQIKNWTLGITALASFMMALDGQVITTAFATIRSDFDASVETLQWISIALVLASGTAKEGPGPLVSMFATAVQAIPVTIVPGNFTNDQIDALA